MNDILQLKGDFERRNNRSGDLFPRPSIKKAEVISAVHLERLADSLESVCTYWRTHIELGGTLVSVTYRRVIPKSARIYKLFSSAGANSIDSICGSKFKRETHPNGCRILKHVFTHFLPLRTLETALVDLRNVAGVVQTHFNGTVNYDVFNSIDANTYPTGTGVSRSKLQGILADVVEVESFSVATPDQHLTEESVVSIYNVGIPAKELLSRYGLAVDDSRILNETTLKLSQVEVDILQRKAPYLISMSVNNIRYLSDEYGDDPDADIDEPRPIPAPAQEPTIGVIDTAFDKNRAYFKEWVEYHEMMPRGVTVRPQDLKHGTSVSSILVDGVKGNQNLEDHCGRFRVRHFGVLAGNRIDSFDFMQKIRSIVSSNLDIKVWNISFGSEMEINENFISPEGALLDELQRIYDITFVIAGTNIPNGRNGRMRIGSPADSLNSIVVNSVGFDDRPASYTREGPVLSFFVKPDVCYYGGDLERDSRIVVNDGSPFAAGAYGTSFAAPWISRKLAYLIHIMGLSREVAKALLIDSAAGWNGMRDPARMGYGIVPRSIRDILSTRDDEIKFVITGTTLAYETYTTSLPVPSTSKGHPFRARATMVYFPWCERNHGVDYTNTEMTLKFGRVKPGENPGDDEIKSLDGDTQGEEASLGNFEIDARNIYRKWDNVKRISDKLTERPRHLKSYNSKNLWGISVVTKERGTQRDGIGLPFGIVVTLREINGENRIDDFISGCRFRSWIVSRLNPDIRLRNYIESHNEIELN